jgi:predicted aldo/keto reductase-like oxidoreductase
MKTLGHGEFPDIQLSLRYALGLDGVSLAIVGMDNTKQIDGIVSVASDFKPLEEREEERLIEQVRPIVEKDAKESQKGKGSLFWLHDTNVMGWEHHDEPRLVSY